jgi:hypothetical protein
MLRPDDPLNACGSWVFAGFLVEAHHIPKFHSPQTGFSSAIALLLRPVVAHLQTVEMSAG